MKNKIMVIPNRTKPIVVLERERIGELPEYCLHGSTTCVNCKMVCWLGSESVKLILSGATPMCIRCVVALEADGVISPARWIGNVQDHLRKDGPH